MQYFNLKDKLAMVTGASSGIGMHLAKTLANAGCIVIITARRLDNLKKLAEEIEDQGGRAIPVRMDVTDRAQVDAVLDQIENQQGPVEILVNNAGMAGHHSFLTAPKEETDQIIAVNQTAVWDVTQADSQRLVNHGKPGTIINISVYSSRMLAHLLLTPMFHLHHARAQTISFCGRGFGLAYWFVSLLRLTLMNAIMKQTQ